MKQVGSRRFPDINLQASGLLLKQGALFNEALTHLAPSTFVPKGVYRYSSHLAANQHALECLSLGMGKKAAEGLSDLQPFAEKAHKIVISLNVHWPCIKISSDGVNALKWQ